MARYSLFVLKVPLNANYLTLISSRTRVEHTSNRSQIQAVTVRRIISETVCVLLSNNISNR